MQFHKIPQNVTQYQGRIIGKFTAHQFVYLAIGGIIIFIIFTAPALSKQHKIAFIAATGLLTALFAIVNYEGRSTDIWILTFLRVVASPTQRVWHKKGYLPAFLLPSLAQRSRAQVKTQPSAPQGRELYSALRKEVLKTGPDLTQEEKQFLKKIRQFYK